MRGAASDVASGLLRARINLLKKMKEKATGSFHGNPVCENAVVQLRKMSDQNLVLDPGLSIGNPILGGWGMLKPV